MQIHCRACDQQLTRDLYPARPKFRRNAFGRRIVTNPSVYTRSSKTGELRVRPGLFYRRRREPKHQPIEPHSSRKDSFLVVGELSFLDGVLPPFKSGYGCCDYGLGEPLICQCGQDIGYMFLDCMDDGSVELSERNTIRKYGKKNRHQEREHA